MPTNKWFLESRSFTKTNKRIKEEFQAFLDKRLVIGFEVLRFDNITIEKFSLNSSSLNNKHLRKLIEDLMIVIYKEKRFQILNL